ncbi:MAG: hypothetical protein WC848_02155 [Parcubacteria group bacterium]|jgi:hypothetical protein
MQMRLNNGTIIDNAPDMSDKSRKQLSGLWTFPSKAETDKEKEKYYVIDYKREWQREFNEKNSNPVI